MPRGVKLGLLRRAEFLFLRESWLEFAPFSPAACLGRRSTDLPGWAEAGYPAPPGSITGIGIRNCRQQGLRPGEQKSMSGTRRATWIAWLDLVRLPGLPSAWSNILMGYLLVGGGWVPVLPLVALLVASGCFFSAGMALNDWFDQDQDLRERPRRPLPAGEIQAAAALRAVLVLMGVGWLAAWLAGAGSPFPGGGFNFAPPIVAAGLAGCIWLYDGPCKRTWLGPPVMGLCRVANVLLGASAAWPRTTEPWWAADLAGWTWPSPLCWQMLAVGLLITGVTWLARQEAVARPAVRPLWMAAALILAGLLVLAGLPWAAWSPPRPENLQWRFALVLGLIGFSPMRRVWTAALGARPELIQQGVVSVLRTLILLDASVCYLAAPDRPQLALAVAALLLPAWWLGRWLRTT